jgi:hypothetical protein
VDSTRAHSFGQFKKHALLKARTQSPCFSYPGLFKVQDRQNCQILVVLVLVLAGRQIYRVVCRFMIERKFGRFIR